MKRRGRELEVANRELEIANKQLSLSNENEIEGVTVRKEFINIVAYEFNGLEYNQSSVYQRFYGLKI